MDLSCTDGPVDGMLFVEFSASLDAGESKAKRMFDVFSVIVDYRVGGQGSVTESKC